MAPPPAEQLLIRDYLSRVAVAARGQLSAAERRALLKSTQEFIEQQTSLSGRPHPMDVAKLLTRLGEPAGLVRMERQRLAALRGEDFEEPDLQVRGVVARVLRRDGGRPPGASWHRTAQEAGAGMRLTLLDGGRAEDARAGNSLSGDAAADDAPDGTASSVGTGPARWPQRRSLVPLPRDEDAGSHSAPDDTDPGLAGSGTVADGADDDAAGDDTPAYGVAAYAEPGDAGTGGWLLNEIAGPVELLEPVDPGGRSEAARVFDRVARQVADFIRGMPGRWRRHPVEVTALLLLGPAGFLFPPLWLIGALVALASKRWHPLDKWAGLATPVALTVVGFVVGLIDSGSPHLGHDVHEGWALAVIVSRFSALLSAGYLAWQARRGRRPAPLPPWKRTH
jgi:hypothetical protein